MTNGEAVKWLINISADIGKAEHRDLWHYEQALSDIREMLETAQPEPSMEECACCVLSRPEPKWIPCSERLSDKEVLCCDTRGEMIIGYPYQDEESNTGYSAVLDDVVMIDCTAWMPLPEPWRGESK